MTKYRAKRVPSADWLDKMQVARLLGVNAGSVDRYRRTDPSFPLPFWITATTPRWSRAEIEQWLASRPRSARAPAFERLHRRRQRFGSDQ
jgi:predicted DNA-binding transcriptional regulator AlpA